MKPKTFNLGIIAVGALFVIGVTASDYFSDKRMEEKLDSTREQLATAKSSLKEVQAEKRSQMILLSEKDLKITQVQSEVAGLKRDLKTAETQVKALSENMKGHNEP
jgi:uncharacterized protein YPO0396